MPNPVCPTNCDSNLPVWNFSDCNPQINLSEIRRLFFKKTTGAPFTDWTDAAEWIERMSQTSVANDDIIRYIDVIADLPAGSLVTKDISKRRKVTITKDRTLPFTIDDVSQENYEAARVLECNAQYDWWWESEGGYMYGGNAGVRANVDINLVGARGADAAEELQGTLTWRYKFMAERTLSPIFDSGTPTTPVYDTILTFASSTTATSDSVTVTASPANATRKFEFLAIDNPTGLPNDMTLYIDAVVSGEDIASVVFKAEYLNKPFKYTHTNGTVYTGTFAAGDVVLS